MSAVDNQTGKLQFFSLFPSIFSFLLCLLTYLVISVHFCGKVHLWASVGVSRELTEIAISSKVGREGERGTEAPFETSHVITQKRQKRVPVRRKQGFLRTFYLKRNGTPTKLRESCMSFSLLPFLHDIVRLSKLSI